MATKIQPPHMRQTTIGELAENFDEWMFLGDTFSKKPKAKGFTIGRGKKLYWYLDPSGRTGKYKVYSLDENDEMIVRSIHYYEPSHPVTIHYKSAHL